MALAIAGSGAKALAGFTGGDQQKLQFLLSNKKPAIWLFTGDSITQGAKHTHGMRSYPEIVAERIRWEMRRLRDIVINTAVSGNTAADLLADMEWRIDHFKPAVVSLMFGTNDCALSKAIPLKDFEQHIDTVIAFVRGRNGIPILHTPTPIMLAKASERRNIGSYAAVIREVATSKQVILSDHWAHWGQVINERGANWVYSNWLNDPLHPNGTGHMEIARLFFRSIGIFDPGTPTCGAPYYEGEHRIE